jgi:hypothetical protein
MYCFELFENVEHNYLSSKLAPVKWAGRTIDVVQVLLLARSIKLGTHAYICTRVKQRGTIFVLHDCSHPCNISLISSCLRI